MQLPDKLLHAEHASSMPIDKFYELAIDKLEELHEKLDRLPKNPYGDDTPTLEGLKADFNVREEKPVDMSMFIMGGFQALGLGALGLSAGATHAADFALGYAAERRANQNTPSARNSFGAAAKPAKAGTRYAFKQEPAKKPLIPATSIVRAAMKRKQMASYTNTLKQRRALESKLRDLKQMFRDLNLYKDLKVTDVMMTENGKELRALYTDKPVFVHKPEEQKYRKRMEMELKLGRKLPKAPAPAPAFAC